MEFKATKGEWKIKNPNTEDYTHIACGKIRIAEVKHYFGRRFPNDPREVEGKANAKLIAAAPDLLKACIHALEMCEDRVTPTENDLTIMAGRLKAPINKALN